MLNDKVYNIMKWIAIVILPAIIALYAGLADVWGFPYATQITATLGLLNTFIGSVLQISTSKYKKAQKEVL